MRCSEMTAKAVFIERILATKIEMNATELMNIGALATPEHYA